jgi:GrpB-like predicted nucleotidyltransferase (UPF0157 family)
MNELDSPTDGLVVGYNSRWAQEFEEIAVVLFEAFGSLARGIHHVGSTSIPGMIAKPVLDIDVELAPGVDISTATKILTSLGYQYQGELGIADRHAYRHMSPAVPLSKHRASWMSHHLYVCPDYSAELVRHLLFRDELRKDVRLRDEYIRLKQEALRRAKGVKQVYVDEKARVANEFFKKVLGS